MRLAKNRLFSLLALLAIFIAACSQQTAQPTIPPAPTGGAQVTSLPTPTSAVPIDTAATATLPPTPALPATVTTVPTATAPLIPVGEGTPTPIVLLSPVDFGADRNPLTGEFVSDPAVLQRRPLAIKISNSPPSWVRPQSGLNEADLVYEHITEATITRFTLVVYGRTPTTVGPIRSARLIDLEIPAMYDAALAYSGASIGVSGRLAAADFAARIIGSNDPGYYRTGADKPFEHTLYGRPEQFWQGLTNKGQNTPPNFTTYMAFSDQPPAGGTPATTIGIDFQWEDISWSYDADSGRYLRWSAGVPHLDGNTNEQVRTTNVVVIYANHTEDPAICEEVRNGVCLHLSVQPQIWGSGSAIVFRDGQRFDVTWRRENRPDMITFYDAAGNPFPLKIGNSWFEIVPTAWNSPVTVTP